MGKDKMDYIGSLITKAVIAVIQLRSGRISNSQLEEHFNEMLAAHAVNVAMDAVAPLLFAQISK